MKAPLDHVPDDSGAKRRWLRTMMWAVLIGLFCWAAVVFAVMLAVRAHAHDALPTASMPLGWKYPYSCCSNQDCKQASDAEVREVVRGYLVTATGEVVPYGDTRVKDSPDGMFHTCQVAGDFAKGRVLCLFVPPRSF